MKYSFLLISFFSCQEKSVLDPGIYYVEESEGAILVEQFGIEEQLYLRPTPILTSEQFALVKVVNYGKGNFGIAIKLDAEGTNEFERTTSEWIGKRLAVVIDGMIQTAPIVQGTIPNGSLQLSNNAYNESICKRLALLID